MFQCQIMFNSDLDFANFKYTDIQLTMILKYNCNVKKKELSLRYKNRSSYLWIYILLFYILKKVNSINTRTYDNI